METPDILAFTVDDAQLLRGNTITIGSPSAQPYDTAFQMTNPRSGNLEYCFVIGTAKTTIRFSDLPCPSYVNKVDLRNIANYSLTGGPSITAVYYRDELLDEGTNYVGSSKTLISSFRHTVYLQLSSTLSNGVTYHVSNSANAFTAFSFTYNDKLMRAGGIKVSQFGIRADDSLKTTYLASRIPGHPSGGVIDFAGTYGITTAQVIDAVTLANVATVNVNLRRAFGDPETANTIVTLPTVVAQGTGYAVNDQITLAGGAGTPAVLKVSTIGAGGACTAVTIVSGGTYTTMPTGNVAQASTTGGGAGATFSSITWTDGYAASGIDIADLSTSYAVTGIEKAAVSAGHPIVNCPGHPFVNGDKCRFHGVSGMTQIEGDPIPTGGAGVWIAPTVTVIDANSFSINVNTSGFTAFSATPTFSTALGGVSNVVHKCINTNRAGTNVYQFDLSSFTTPGNYYLYIPGYGISDPFYVGTEAYSIMAGNLHNGVFNLRLGCDLNAAGYTRPLASVDGANGTAIYWSGLIASFSSEGAQQIAPTGGVVPASGTGAYSDEGTLVLATQVWGDILTGAVTPAVAGTGYAVNDQITLAGGSGTAAVLNVSSIGAGGSVTGVTIASGGFYSSIPSTPVSQASTTGSGINATFTIPSASFTGGVQATTTVPHGIPGTYPFIYPLSTINSLPAGYNFASSTSNNIPNWATITGASTFTYPVSANPGANTQLGVARTGFLTSRRATGARAPTQDAGDNDDLACDHLHAFQQLAWVFNNIPANSRFTPFVVPLSTTLLDPTLYAGTNSLPPLFHEICWYADNYRVLQDGNGDVPGGYGLGHFSSQIPDYPEPIYLNRGTDPLGHLAGQTTMCFVYASDQYTTMQFAALAAQIALICQGYSLTTLATTWFNSAVAAYNRALALMSDLTVRDAYYVSTLNLPTKMGWTNAQYNEVMGTLTGTTVVQGHAAAAAFYRYLGQSAGQNPYGNYIEGQTLVAAPAIGTGSGGSGYAVGDLITFAGGTVIGTGRTIVRVTGVGGSGNVTTAAIYYPGQYTAAPTTPFTQLSTTGSGAGFSFQTATFAVTYSSVATDNPNTGAFDYIATPGNNATAKSYLQTHSSGSSAANSAFYVSTARSFCSMQAVNNTTSGTQANAPLANLIAHMILYNQNNSIPTSRSSNLLQSMATHIQWLNGANLPGLCMTANLGVRTPNNFLHEDQFKMGVPVPPGIVYQAYFSFAPVGLFAFDGVGVNTDGQLQSVADNITGSNEGLVQPGSAKQWNGWRFGESFWEFKCQSRWESDFVAEFTLERMILSTALSLYCHGWDGNV